MTPPASWVRHDAGALFVAVTRHHLVTKTDGEGEGGSECSERQETKMGRLLCGPSSLGEVLCDLVKSAPTGIRTQIVLCFYGVYVLKNY